MAWVLDFFLHLDRHLSEVIDKYDTWTYLILFSIIYVETGLVVMPFLPGDSLLFAAGLFAHEERGGLNVWLLVFLLPTAALLGDVTNYHVGKAIGQRVFRSERARFFSRRNLERTHAFFERHGPKTIIIARFVPIVRTCAPFVAGMGYMTFPKFIKYSVIGALLWVHVCVWAGYWFGRIPVVKDNFSLAILAIVCISVAPAVVEVAKHRLSGRRRAAPRDPGPMPPGS